MADTPALAACPFCGGPGEMHENDWCEPPEYHVGCHNLACMGGTTGSTDRAKAIAAWNKRTPPVGFAIVPREPTEEARWRVALAINGHRCYGATTPELRAEDRCWQSNETCRCRIAYESVDVVWRAMLAESGNG